MPDTQQIEPESIETISESDNLNVEETLSRYAHSYFK